MGPTSGKYSSNMFTVTVSYVHSLVTTLPGLAHSLLFSLGLQVGELGGFPVKMASGGALAELNWS